MGIGRKATDQRTSCRSVICRSVDLSPWSGPVTTVDARQTLRLATRFFLNVVIVDNRSRVYNQPPYLLTPGTEANRHNVRFPWRQSRRVTRGQLQRPRMTEQTNRLQTNLQTDMQTNSDSRMEIRRQYSLLLVIHWASTASCACHCSVFRRTQSI